VITNSGWCLDGGRATGNERPREQSGAIDRRAVQPFGARRAVRLLELLATRVEGAKGMTEKAVLGFSGRNRRGICADVVGAFVVGDGSQAARDVVCTIGVRQRNGSHTEARKQQKSHRGTLNPRRAAGHQIELSRLSLRPQSQRPGVDAGDERVGSLYRFAIDVKEHRFA
jgi:hypothetical protein